MSRRLWARLGTHPADNDALVDHADELLLRARTNRWLGVDQVGFGFPYEGKGRAWLPDGPCADVADWMKTRLWPVMGVEPNIAYVQSGGPVAPHRDPRADLYVTTIAYFGDFTGGELVIQESRLKKRTVTVRPGDVVALACTRNGQQGPRHWTKPHKGHRASIILNYREIP